MRTRLTTVLIIVVGLAALAAAFAFARPSSTPTAALPPDDLPYTSVSYSRADAVVAFAAVGVRLTPRSKSVVITTLGNRGDALEVDIFGDARQVKASGFYDYLPLNGRYVHFPRTCGTAIGDAERWKGNVRVIVDCTAAAPAAWLRRAQRALARLGA